MHLLFAVTLFVSAALLFAVQPMIAKMLLPRFGGAPAVWNTCMLFFQAALLLGYGYVHLLTRRLPLRRQVAIHLVCLLVGLLLAPLVLLPLDTPSTPPWQGGDTGGVHPNARLLGLLAISVGLPFVVLSATAPLLQKWFSGTRHHAAGDPFFLYSASNLGSLAALAGYPLLLEPTLRLSTQGWLWVVGFGLLVGLASACAWLSWRHAPARPTASTLEPLPLSAGWRTRFRWLFLAFVPSSLLYGVTTYLSTDIAAVPLLWVLPLAIYLLTFIVAFARRPTVAHDKIVLLFPLAVLWQTFVFALQRPIWLLFVLHLASFFVVALACHGELARLRPSPRHLTAFYLWLSAGGVLGGVFNALLAPLLFSSLVEYPLALVLACFVIPPEPTPTESPPSPGGVPAIDWHDVFIPLILFLSWSALIPEIAAALKDQPADIRLPAHVTLMYGLPAAIVYFFRTRPLRFGLGVGAILLAAGMAGEARGGGTLVLRERSFFGILRVVDVKDPDDADVVFRRFVHGDTLHGMQRLSDDPAIRRTPLSYYFRSGPMGEVFGKLGAGRRRVGVLGLGAGGLASYAEDGQAWTFYELDPAVVGVADSHFDFLADARQRGAAVDIALGDGRLGLEADPHARFDLLFADAFSSDAVPVHLLTRQALALYRERLAPGGLLVVNVTNRYLDLEPVLAALADEAGMTARIREEVDHETASGGRQPVEAPPRRQPAEDGAKRQPPEGALDFPPQPISALDRQQGKAPSRWIVLAERVADLGPLAASPRWRPLRRPADFPPWTDDFSNLLRVLRW